MTILDGCLLASEIINTASVTDEGEFWSMPLQHLAVGWDVPFDVYLKTKVKGTEQPTFTLVCPQGQVFEEAWFNKLQELKITWVYYPVAQEEQVLQYLAHNLDLTLQDNRYSNQERARQVYEVTLVWLRHFFLEEKGPIQAQLESMQQFIDRLFECVQREKAYSDFVLSLRRYDGRVYTHCLNVCLIGLAFANYLGWRDNEVQAFALGALVHDVGMVKVPKSVLQKTVPLSPQEFALIKQHPILGAQMLQNFTARREALLMVQQHHENGDGSGYPKGLQFAAIHPWARILRILDSYEAMTSHRPWRAARAMRETLWSMRQDWEKSQIYDPGYLTPFIRFLAGR